MVSYPSRLFDKSEFQTSPIVELVLELKQAPLIQKPFEIALELVELVEPIVPVPVPLPEPEPLSVPVPVPVPLPLYKILAANIVSSLDSTIF